MALFRKPREQESGPDPVFPFFTVDQASRFRELIRQGFAEAGLEVTAYADHLVDSKERVFGLGNVAAACHNDERGERAWREITAQHAARIVRAMDAPSPFDTMSQEQLYAATFPRVMAAEDIAPMRVSYARPVAAGLVEILNVDLPDTVAVYLDEHVNRYGPYDDLRRAAHANLRRVQFGTNQVLEHNGARINVVMDESMFVASAMLILDDVVSRYEPLPAAEAGMFVAVPFRHQLVFHVLRDATAIPSLQALAMFAQAGFDDSIGPVSPDVFWWHDGRIDCLTVRENDETRIEVGPELADVLNRLVD